MESINRSSKGVEDPERIPSEIEGEVEGLFDNVRNENNCSRQNQEGIFAFLALLGTIYHTKEFSMATIRETKGRQAGLYVVITGRMATNAAAQLSRRFNLAFRGDLNGENGRVGPFPTMEGALAFGKTVKGRGSLQDRVAVEKLDATAPGYLIELTLQERLRGKAVSQEHGVRFRGDRIGPVSTRELAQRIVAEIERDL